MSDIPETETAELTNWLLARGLEGTGQGELLEGYCRKLLDLGVPLERLHVAQRAFHPEYGGIGFDWCRDAGFSDEQYAYTDTPRQRWLVSPFFMMLREGLWDYREPLGEAGFESTYPLLQELQAQGATDYMASAVPFERQGQSRQMDPHNTPEGMLISWTSYAPGGFTADHRTVLHQTLQTLGLALKSASNRQMARDLMQVYLGRDAGNRVLSGEIRRGSLRSIDAVICYFDLAGFTAMTEQLPAATVVDMLNDYFALAVDTIRDHGGHVLKFMGDGMLAMFDHDEMRNAAYEALDTAVDLVNEMERLSTDRAARGLPSTGFTLALHAGEILYGNIGAKSRLDFTVIGAAVNQTARIGGMHGALGQNMLISEAVVEAAPNTPHDLVPMGRYMLRGVSEPQSLYTIYFSEN